MSADPKPHILIVDDDPEFAEATKDLLEAEGYEVCVAGNGAEGLKAIKGRRPDLVLLDVMMGTDTEGFEISRRINEDPALRKLPIIMITGVSRAMGLPYALEPDESWLPVAAVFEKPVAPARLLAEIAKCLGR